MSAERMTKREDGFYWVCVDSQTWETAEFRGGKWAVLNIRRPVTDGELFEIGDRLIPPAFPDRQQLDLSKEEERGND